MVFMAKKRKKRVYKILAPGLVKCPNHDKVLHRNIEDAERAAKRFRKHWGSKMDVYHCPEYEGWHIGHPRAHKGRKAGKKKDLFERIK